MRGPGIDRLTFRQLLTHTSGLVALNEPGAADYPFMKNQIAIGVVGAMGYRNMNYGLCRILISTIDAPFLFDLLPTVDDIYGTSRPSATTSATCRRTSSIPPA